MRYLLIFFLTLLVTFVIHAQKRSDQLTWLKGKWNRKDIRGQAQAFEEWKEETSGSLTGIGVMLEGKDTVFIEHLAIRKRLGNLFYVTEVAHNTEPTWFKITSISNDSFICENETHDFPKKIGYFLDNKTLTVKISGNSRVMSFIFIKED